MQPGGGIVEPWQATLLAGLVAALVMYHLHRLNSRRAACIKFRGAFSEALGRLEAARLHASTHDRPDVDKLLHEHFERHSAAVSEFRPFVPQRARSLFDRHWREYCSWVAPAGSSPSFLGEFEGEPFAAIEKRIHAILAFASDT